jgi:hypothetical protein
MKEAVSKERSQTIGEAVTWCGGEVGVEVSYKKLYDWFRGWGLSAEGAPADGGESGCAGAGKVEKGGLLEALQAEGIKRGV